MPESGPDDYEQIFASTAVDFNICYYCGDCAVANDYIPPLAQVECFEANKALCDFFIVPCCKECRALGGNEPHGRLDERAAYIRDCLASKYAEDWKRTQLWKEEEVSRLIEEEGETGIIRSLRAIVDSECDLTSRLTFRGYPFEVNGSTYTVGGSPSEKYQVFEEQFDTFKEALEHSSETYKVKPDVLFEYAKKFGGDITSALGQLFRDQEKLQLEKELKTVARKIAHTHRKDRRWVFRSLKEMQNSFPEASLEEIAKKLVDKYITGK